ncbi:endoplasmic reticulum-Golgi intermediate compartment protein 1 [Exaiptasia diaphana]|uniref:Endoplasmic reticulum-Golgi intermediate compartment protein 1 n=1 Tax=Exaiptasia diaphana TaxID=2652724 RepID=A0A913WSE4_EXADI|nr:endoplasmic reticulum-Golgi intermediate compartment protein 1 [Exaiptasia diaphana]KXJ18404.1 Endoplasmic reticulum-Golgi intermediate compartment protein 1 [Exaiptasia diaphana]
MMQFDVRRLDIYRKVPKDLTEPTTTGAVISVLSCLFMTFLFLSEFYSFIGTEIVSELFVDNPSGSNELPVELNITLPRIRCDFLGLDIQDEMGRHEVSFQQNIERIPIDGGEGCQFQGHFNINKVPGNFHISTHGAGRQPDNPDMAHTINSLKFGEQIMEKIPGAFTALQDHDKQDANALSSHDYILKIVPTIFQKLDGTTKFSYQYTWAYKDYITYSHGGAILPATWFRYDLSPITVKYIERRKPLYHFITTICAIIGGTFTVAGIIDSSILTATEMFKKHQLGKLS